MPHILNIRWLLFPFSLSHLLLSQPTISKAECSTPSSDQYLMNILKWNVFWFSQAIPPLFVYNIAFFASYSITF